MGRKPCCSKEGLNRGAWTAMEDKILVSYIKTHGEGKWRGLPKRAGLKRCGKSCRLRWLNYLRPGIKRGNISEDEEDLILRLHKLLGNRLCGSESVYCRSYMPDNIFLCSGRLPGRTDNEIKNYWNTNLGRRVHGRHSYDQLSKPKPIANSKDKIPTTEPPMADTPAPKAKTESNIIRTKAVKCTRAFFPQGQHMPPPVITNHQHADSVLKESEGPLENLGGNYDSSDDLRMNLNAVGTSSGFEFLQAMGDPGIQIGSNTIGEDDIDINMVMYSDDLLSLDGFQSDIGLNLQSMVSFQDSEEEWFQI